MKKWQIKYENGDIIYITMDIKGVSNMWIYDPYITEIREI
jgi:hypothetical protein